MRIVLEIAVKRFPRTFSINCLTMAVEGVTWIQFGSNIARRRNQVFYYQERKGEREGKREEKEREDRKRGEMEGERR